jgi:two-component system phosphate regulon sensor histidine kinase PhoR
MLSAVLGQMTDGVLIADNSGRVQLLNKEAEKLFMVKERDALGRSVVEVMRHHRLVELWEETRNGPAKTITMEMGAMHKYLQVVGIPLGRICPGDPCCFSRTSPKPTASKLSDGTLSRTSLTNSALRWRA